MTPQLCVCTHPPHPDRACAALRVSGPAVDNDREPLSAAGEHRGRIVTPCGCTDYMPELNGNAVGGGL